MVQRRGPVLRALHLFFFIFSLQSSTIDACPPQADSTFKNTRHWLLVFV
jgi:hypothetical protein